MLTPAQTAHLLHISPSYLRELSSAGRIESERTPGGHRRYSPEAVEAFRTTLDAAAGEPNMDEPARSLMSVSQMEPILAGLHADSRLPYASETAQIRERDFFGMLTGPEHRDLRRAAFSALALRIPSQEQHYEQLMSDASQSRAWRRDDSDPSGQKLWRSYEWFIRELASIDGNHRWSNAQRVQRLTKSLGFTKSIQRQAYLWLDEQATCERWLWTLQRLDAYDDAGYVSQVNAQDFVPERKREPNHRHGVSPARSYNRGLDKLTQQLSSYIAA